MEGSLDGRRKRHCPCGVDFLVDPQWNAVLQQHCDQCIQSAKTTTCKVCNGKYCIYPDHEHYGSEWKDWICNDCLLNVECRERVCLMDRRDEEFVDNPMLICDECCVRGAHLGCVYLDEVPQNRWFCIDCRAVKQGRRPKRKKVDDPPPVPPEEQVGDPEPEDTQLSATRPPRKMPPTPPESPPPAVPVQSPPPVPAGPGAISIPPPNRQLQWQEGTGNGIIYLRVHGTQLERTYRKVYVAMQELTQDPFALFWKLQWNIIEETPHLCWIAVTMPGVDEEWIRAALGQRLVQSQK